jgi:large subunit ribosomal protein L25
MSTFQAQRRPEKALKPHQMRRNGIIPMALISRDHGTTLLQASRTDVQRALRHLDGHGGIDLEIEDEKGKKKVIVKHVENNPLHGGILTVTLQEVSAKDVVKLDVSVIAVNQRADEQGTVLTQPTTQVRLQGKMSDIPSNIEVDVSHLEVGHHVNAGDIALPDGVKLLSSPDATLFSMQVLKAVSLEPELAEEPVEGEAPAEEPETESGATEEDNG